MPSLKSSTFFCALESGSELPQLSIDILIELERNKTRELEVHSYLFESPKQLSLMMPRVKEKHPRITFELSHTLEAGNGYCFLRTADENDEDDVAQLVVIVPDYRDDKRGKFLAAMLLGISHYCYVGIDLDPKKLFNESFVSLISHTARISEDYHGVEEFQEFIASIIIIDFSSKPSNPSLVK